MSELYLPVLSHFQNENIWLASLGRMRYRVVPGETLSVELWEGPWAYDLSQVEETKEFPLTEEGIEALRVWLPQRAEEINARPEHTMAENLARKKA